MLPWTIPILLQYKVLLLVLQAIQVKNNISQFSGFVWHENEVRGLTFYE